MRFSRFKRASGPSPPTPPPSLRTVGRISGIAGRKIQNVRVVRSSRNLSRSIGLVALCIFRQKSAQKALPKATSWPFYFSAKVCVKLSIGCFLISRRSTIFKIKNSS